MSKEEQFQHECYEVIVAVWKALKPRLAVSHAESYWDDAIEAFADVAARYEGTPADMVAHHLSVAAVKALEDIYRQQIGANR